MSVYSGRVEDPSLATEILLFAKARCGCQVSLSRLMVRHDGLVQAIVRRQYLGDLSFAEVLQVGRIGLWRAILGFEPERGWAFSTYAWPVIMHHVWQAVKRQTRDKSGLVVALPAPDRLATDPAVQCETVALRETLYDLVGRLPARLHGVIVAYYGLDDSPPSSYRQLGKRLGLSHERVRQLHVEALVWLRHPAHSQALRTLLRRHALSDYEQADTLAQRWLRRRAGRHDR